MGGELSRAVRIYHIGRDCPKMDRQDSERNQDLVGERGRQIADGCKARIKKR